MFMIFNLINFLLCATKTLILKIKIYFYTNVLMFVTNISFYIDSINFKQLILKFRLILFP